jgi:hypothetical protein
MLIQYLFEKFPNWEEIGSQAIGDLQVRLFPALMLDCYISLAVWHENIEMHDEK